MQLQFLSRTDQFIIYIPLHSIPVCHFISSFSKYLWELLFPVEAGGYNFTRGTLHLWLCLLKFLTESIVIKCSVLESECWGSSPALLFNGSVTLGKLLKDCPSSVVCKMWILVLFSHRNVLRIKCYFMESIYDRTWHTVCTQ